MAVPRSLCTEAAALALDWDWPEYHALIEAAYAEPRLRRLYPYTTHLALRFSTRTRPALSTIPLPRLRAGRDSHYAVTMDWVDFDDDAAGALGTCATAQDAVALVVRHPPPDLGPVASGERSR